MRNTVVGSFEYKFIVIVSLFHQENKYKLCGNFIFHNTSNMQIMMKIVGLLNSMTESLLQLYAST